MTHVQKRPGWRMPDRDATPERIVLGRREFLRRLGVAGAAVAAGGLLDAGAGGLVAPRLLGRWAEPAARDPRFTLDRPVTDASLASSSCVFYEFAEERRRVAEAARAFAMWPWRLRIDGLVSRPRSIDLDELAVRMPREERLYRHRCVEGWSMAVPWTGFPLASLVAWASPLGSARYLRVESFSRPDQAPNQRRATWFPWPYAEALRLDEATHPLAFVATGIYGHDLPRQHGGPIRLALPWKYGLKSAKSIVRLTFVAERPATFWSSVAPDEYGFLSNVNPRVPHPRWSQVTERPLGGEPRPTLPYNGYGEWVAGMYDRVSETHRS